MVKYFVRKKKYFPTKKLLHYTVMFGYLNTHSHYSLLRGVAKVPALLERAKATGCDAIALTDTHNLYGAIEFYKKAQEADIRPILGVTLGVRSADAEQVSPIVLLAQNKQGYHNILELITQAHFEEGKTPALSLEQISNRKDGIIALLPALNNPVQQSLIQQDAAAATTHLTTYKNIFGQNLCIGISPQNPTPKDGTAVTAPTETLVALAREHKVNIIPAPLIYLLEESDKEARDVLLRIQRTTRSNLEEEVFEDPLLFPNRNSIEAWCKTVCPEALQTLSDLIQSINWELELGNWVFPNPPIGNDTRDHAEILREHVEQGFDRRELQRTSEAEERIDFELGVITERGYTDYFLSVIDLIKHMHSNGIITTTRGSAAGSLVSYLAGITNVNPLEYQLPFERFLNPFRPSPPDIDMDIADNRRNEVIDYILNCFGKEKVAQIGTLGTMMARAAVRDTARALGYSYMTGDRIAKLIPPGAQGAPMYIDTALETEKELRDLHNNDETVQHIIRVAKKIEGNARHISVHAAGVVISPTTAVAYTPLERDPKGVTDRPITQYDMHAVEDAGLLKFDILGLTNLAILAGAIELTQQDKGIAIDVEKIPLDDKKTYKLIGDGYTIGVFQLGGSGMTSVLKRMKPTSMYDIAAIVALYRPGPMGNIDEYIARKQGKKPISYIHPKMESYLKNSYGVLVYQDDLLYTAIELAGYDWKEVDVFRKAVGKKIPELMAEQEKVFKERVKKRSGLSDAQANKIWDLFDPFKGYGFNKAHAMSYAKVAYQTAYMKAHYPAQYMTAHLTAVAGETENVAELVYEAKRIELEVQAPELNSSSVSFSTEKGKDDKESIRIGLETIKQVGTAAAEAIVSEREKNGKYTALEDFFTRIGPYNVINKRSLEALIKTGVLDMFEKRDVLLENIELLLECTKDTRTGEQQHALFDATANVSLELQPAKSPVNKAQELYWEKELLGVYVSGHPLDLCQREGLHLRDILRKEENSKVLTTAVIAGLKPFRNKSGERMYFLTLEDDDNNKIEAACFPREAEEFDDLLALYRPIKIRGSTSFRNNETTLRIDQIENPTPLPTQQAPDTTPDTTQPRASAHTFDDTPLPHETPQPVQHLS